MYTADMNIGDIVKGKTLSDTVTQNRKDRSFISPVTLEKHLSDLHSLKAHLVEKEHKMEQMHNKLFVDFEGDTMKGSYNLRFNQFRPDPDGIQRSIILKFIEEHGLELHREIDEVDNLIELVEAIMKLDDYCEVDLFDKEKKPVEC